MSIFIQIFLVGSVTRSHQIAHVGVSPSINLKLISREIIFEIFQPIGSRYLNVTERQTDGQTTDCGITTLCVASRGENPNSTSKLHDPSLDPTSSVPRSLRLRLRQSTLDDPSHYFTQVAAPILTYRSTVCSSMTTGCNKPIHYSCSTQCSIGLTGSHAALLLL